ncbi:hypothetical protein RHGRI_015496 [Rhododendron griersonianum]|uniref:F-box associated beta-propeller type 1 domain-containing protein n=1 Tax=Rhododendron griersonianum TaxID=479676 RepID=A0AAV6KDI1_9ERIC|nr:hypothetical protein RHGRI_015496 [Rhododendron griersonianum]
MSLIINDGFTHGPINLDFPFLNRSKNLCIWEFTKKKHFSVVGICHGLVCINLSPFGYPVILCNPLTREFREIPKCEWLLDCDCYVKVKWVGFGFGFLPSARDYKLIQITLCSSPVQEVVIRAHLYAMGTDTWKEIDVDKVSAFFGETDDFGRIGSFVQVYGSCASAALNGVIYWPARVMPTDEVIVMSFDMGNEFGEIANSEWNCFDEKINIDRDSFGFGFHPGANDYKLIRIVLYASTSIQVNIRADLYVMSTDTWTEIDVNKLSPLFGELNELGEYDNHLQIGANNASAVLKGVFYWPARPNLCVGGFNDSDVATIVAELIAG